MWIPQISKPPPELIEIIRNLSLHELVWRSIAVIRLVTRLSTSSAPLLKVPLDAILSWERGGELAYTALSYPRWFRPTIDLDGISKVEKLHERPLYDGTVTERLAFIVENLPGINTELKVHLSRLYLG